MGLDSCSRLPWASRSGPPSRVSAAHRSTIRRTAGGAFRIVTAGGGAAATALSGLLCVVVVDRSETRPTYSAFKRRIVRFAASKRCRARAWRCRVRPDTTPLARLFSNRRAGRGKTVIALRCAVFRMSFGGRPLCSSPTVRGSGCEPPLPPTRLTLCHLHHPGLCRQRWR